MTMMIIIIIIAIIIIIPITQEWNVTYIHVQIINILIQIILIVTSYF
jgi:hypothetical protein